MPVTFFQSLRGLRDRYKRRLMYATVARSALPAVLQDAGFDPLASEPFVELFHDHAVYLGAHAPDDAQAMVQDMLGRRNAPMNVAVVAAILSVTGAFPACCAPACMRCSINPLSAAYRPATSRRPFLVCQPSRRSAWRFGEV